MRNKQYALISYFFPSRLRTKFPDPRLVSRCAGSAPAARAARAQTPPSAEPSVTWKVKNIEKIKTYGSEEIEPSYNRIQGEKRLNRTNSKAQYMTASDRSGFRAVTHG